MSDIEEIELTSKGLHILLAMTREPDAYTDQTKVLVRLLHSAALNKGSNRWVVRMTAEDIKTAVVLYEGYFLNHPTSRWRQVNQLSRQSGRFEREFASFGKAA